MQAASRRPLRRALFTTTTLAGLIAQAYAQTPPAPAAAASAAAQTVTITGYRGSLAQSAQAKRDAIGLSETVVAEEMGKFPDANLAESLARIPGVTVTREITGEGLQIQIRGLGSSFTRILLNGAPVASASTGRTDAQSANREVDLDFLPTELFTKLTVNKSPTAAMLEGGAAGVVDMRSARPFDKRGTRGSISVQGMKNEGASLGNKGSALGSMTFGDTFGILGGVAWSQNKVKTTGFETIGWTNANLSADQSSSGSRNSTGGGNWTIPGTVPANSATGVSGPAAALLTPGATINQAMLLALNPGANIDQINKGLIPRLGRDMVAEGNRDRVNGIFSVEWRPTDRLDFFLDGVVGKKHNMIERSDMNWVGRFGAAIPVGLQFDRSDCSNGCVVTKGTFANAQWFLEYRPFEETTTFTGVNPGFEFRISDTLTLDGQANFTKSKFHRESPTVLVITPGSSGFTVDYDNSSGTPVIRSNRSLNDPANFGWAGGRVNVQEEKREAETKGLRFNLTWGDANFGVKGGAAYDDVYRRITSLNNDAAWQNAVCGNNLSVMLPGPNSTNPGGCNGAVNTGQSVGQFLPPTGGYGTGYTAGANPAGLSYLGSLIPQANLRNYLTPNDRGFIALDWNKFKADSQYDRYSDNAPVSTGSTNTGTNPGYIQERVTGFYVETNGRTQFLGNQLRYNAGVRRVETEQIFGTLISTTDPRNAAQSLGDGGRFPNIITEELSTTKYSNTLPSASVAYNLAPSVISRLSVSRSMTRPNPQDLRRTQLQFSDPSAGQGTLTNSELKPYVSDNLDMGLEWYTGREGYMALSLFKKDIQAFTAAQNTVQTFGSLNQYGVNFQSITQQQRDALLQRALLPIGLTTLTGAQQATIDGQTVVITQQVNSPALLKVKGLEVTWQQPLNFLPIPGFGFTANYTYINQKATNNSGFIATGVPEYTSNLTAYYEQGGFMFRVSRTFSKGSQQTNSPQNGITAAQLYGDDYAQVDISARADLGKLLGWYQNLELTLDVWNANRAKQRAYFQFPNATFTEYSPGATYLVGLRAKF